MPCSGAPSRLPRSSSLVQNKSAHSCSNSCGPKQRNQGKSKVNENKSQVPDQPGQPNSDDMPGLQRMLVMRIIALETEVERLSTANRRLLEDQHKIFTGRRVLAIGMEGIA